MCSSLQKYGLCVVAVLVITASADLSNLRKCADPNCRELIATGRTVAQYNSPLHGILSFRNNAVVMVYSKEAGSNADLWGVEINGKRGYAPRKFIKEEKMLVQDHLLTHVVPVGNLLTKPPEEHKNDDSNNENIQNNDGNQIFILETDNIEEDFEDENGEEYSDSKLDKLEHKGLNEVSEDFSEHDKSKSEKAITPSEEELPSPTAELAPSTTSESEHANPPNEPEHSLPHTEPDVLTHTVDKDISSPAIDVEPAGVNSEDVFQHDLVGVSPTPKYEVVDGTTIFLDAEEFITPSTPSLADFVTPPPLPSPPLQQDQTIVMAAATQLGMNTATPTLEIIPSGQSSHLVSDADVTSTISASPSTVQTILESGSDKLVQDAPAESGILHPSTTRDADGDNGAMEPVNNKKLESVKLPNLLSTLSGGMSDDSNVHATTASVMPVEETDLHHDSSDAVASETLKDDISTSPGGGDSNSDAHGHADAVVNSADIKPTNVEPPAEGWLSSITSSIASSVVRMFPEESVTEGSDNGIMSSTDADHHSSNKVEQPPEDKEDSNVAESTGDSVEKLNSPEQLDQNDGKTVEFAAPKLDDIVDAHEINSAAIGQSFITAYPDTASDSENTPDIKPLDKEQDPNESLQSDDVQTFEDKSISNDETGSDEQTNDELEILVADEISVKKTSGEYQDPLIQITGENIEEKITNDSSDGSENSDGEKSKDSSFTLSDASGGGGIFSSWFGESNVEIKDKKDSELPSHNRENEASDSMDRQYEESESHDSAIIEDETSGNSEMTDKTADDKNEYTEIVSGLVDIPLESDTYNTNEIPHTITQSDGLESIVNEMGASSDGLQVASPSINSDDVTPIAAAQSQANVDEIPVDLRNNYIDDSTNTVVNAHPVEDETSAKTESGSESEDNIDAGKSNEFTSGDDSSNHAIDGSDKLHSPASEPDQDSTADLHDPNSLTGRLLQVLQPIMAWVMNNSQLGDSLSLALESEVAEPSRLSSGSLIALLLLSVTIVALYAVHTLLAKCSREGPLLAALNALEHEQHVAMAFIKDLQDQIQSSSMDTRLPDSGEAARLADLLQQSQAECSALSSRAQELEQELEESTSSGLEMHAMLQDLLHAQKDTANFQESVDHLQTMLDSQREKVESLTADLTIKTALNDELKAEAQVSRERISRLEYQLEQVSHSLEEVSNSKAQVSEQLVTVGRKVASDTERQRSLEQQYTEAAAALQEARQRQAEAEQRADRSHQQLRTRDAELQVTKECLKQLKVFKDGKESKQKFSELLDVIKVQSRLSISEQERNRLQQAVQEHEAEQTQRRQQLEQALADTLSCRQQQEQAQEERAEALSKLAVLTSYFKEKEAQLTKELESESGLRQNAQGSAENVTSRIRDYDMQLMAYKTQLEVLKKELEDQEQSYRAQLAAQEQKTHESWVAARAAERKYEESKQETSQLRSRLLLMAKEAGDHQKAGIKRVEVSNGSMSSPRAPLHDDLDGEHSMPLIPLDSPPPLPLPHMLPPHLFHHPPGGPPLPPGMPPFPPPPGMHPPPPFLHHPLPPPLHSDRRIPPAGRLASPPFQRRLGAASPPTFLDRSAHSPPFDHHRRSHSPAHYDRRSYSPGSEHSRYSDRQGRYSPDRHSERQYDRHQHNTDRYSDRYSPEHRPDSSPDRWYNRSPDGYARKDSPVQQPPPRRIYDEASAVRRGKKTSTPLGPNDR